MDAETITARRSEIAELLRLVHQREALLRIRSARRYQTALRILNANPGARVREELAEALNALRSLRE